MASAPLKLAHDGEITAPTLAAHLGAWASNDTDRRHLAALLTRIAEASVPLAARLAQGHLTGDPTDVIGTNESGDKQKALDIGAHGHFIAALRDLCVARVLSEEAEGVELIDPEGRFDIAMDPIDGSGSIGIGAPLGALFCVFPAGNSFLRPGREIIAACYVSFGHSVDFGFSTGEGVAIATLDPVTGFFHVDATGVELKPETATVAFNASNQRRWTPGLRQYVDDLLLGVEGPRGRDFNMRWIAAAVGDLHRILRRGGLFLYPGDSRSGYEDGFLRLAYEAFPIAYLIEQAGGAATDGHNAILDLTPAHLHDRVPLIFGSRAEAATLLTYLSPSNE
ncbi:class 1 fructose-bisphosphatase [Marivita sp. XM-24bin2]|uniref:class 1 fructose-bisphosphatase n=1 Tax=Marivita sp. XM-24bin2 TaxID=2133951 RepID=UPI000D7A9609|nr:class 1 fructose-bisphosphatase [Marivita sp. XM-24bin2]PWL33424.1 MAG: class 1 fructose-bisphosphatase [Marivita sp. XM-24bin2]